MKTTSPTLPPLRSTPLFLGRFSTFPTANVPYRHTRCFCNDIIGNAVKNFVSIPYHRYIFSKITVKKSINHLQENVLFYKKHLAVDNKKTPLSKGAREASLQSLDFLDSKTRPLRYDIQRNAVITEALGHGLFLFQSFSLSFCFSFFLTFIKFVFKSHVLVPYESVGFEKRHLFIDSFSFVGDHISSCKVLHISLHDRIRKILIPCKYIKILIREIVQANYEPKHNRVGNVKFIERFNIHDYPFVKMQERNIQTKITKNAVPLHFANNCLQESAIFYKEAA